MQHFIESKLNAFLFDFQLLELDIKKNSKCVRLLSRFINIKSKLKRKSTANRPNAIFSFSFGQKIILLSRTHDIALSLVTSIKLETKFFYYCVLQLGHFRSF